MKLPDSDKVLVQSATRGVADRLEAHFRAPAPSTGSRVSLSVISRQTKASSGPRSSASADVLDGLGYWR